MDQQPSDPLAHINDVRHVAIIMDGNGRWATLQGLPRRAGHQRGVESLRNIIKSCVEFGVQELSVYVFSAENWNRPKDEVTFLMTLFKTLIQKEVNELHRQHVKVHFVGNLSALSPQLQKKIAWAHTLTEKNSTLILNLCVNYGGRQEILQAVSRIANDIKTGTIPNNTLDEATFERYLYQPAMSMPDLLIRTGGDLRISNFLLWQIAYTEIFVTNTYWPEFGREEFKQALDAFRKRERRFGGLNA